MIIGVEWDRKSLAYERLWDIAEVLGVDICEPFCGPGQRVKEEHMSFTTSFKPVPSPYDPEVRGRCRDDASWVI